MMDHVLIEHTAIIYGSAGDTITVAPHEDGLYRITYSDGDTEPTSIILPPGMASALSPTILRVVSLNTTKGP